MQLNTKTILIHGKMGGGKTLFAVLLSANWERRILGNVTILHKNKQVSLPVKKLTILNTFSYEKTPGVILFDEMGLNFNSKNHGTDKNKQLSNFFFIVRKYNLSTIFISQRFSSIPIDMRELADLIYEISIIHRKKKHPLFKITRQTTNSEGILEFEDEYIFDIISYLQIFDISYNTLESSLIE